MNDNSILYCTPVSEWPNKPFEFIVANNGDTVTSSLSKGILSLAETGGKTFLIDWWLIDRYDGVKVLCPHDAVAQVDTVTTTVLPQTYTDKDKVTYNITLQWKVAGNSQLFTKKYSVDFLTSTTWTEATVTAAFITKIMADPDRIVTATANANHLVLTAVTAGQGFVTKVSSAVQTLANTLANKVQFGGGANFIEFMGWTASDGIEDSNDTEYMVVEIPYYKIDGGDQPTNNGYSGQRSLQKMVFWLLVETGGSAEDAVMGTSFSTGLCKILAGGDTAAKYLQVVSEGCPCS